jgi:hypothetical protein
MGKVYKRKRHSCSLCKPHKMHISPKHTDRQRMEQREANREIKNASNTRREKR